MPEARIPDLASYDVIMLCSSGGKDSLRSLGKVVPLAEAAGVRDRLVVVHNDLGNVAWPETLDFVKAQARHYQLPWVITPTRPQGDLLHQIEHERKDFPAPGIQWCTSDQKTHQTYPLITSLSSPSRLEASLNKYWPDQESREAIQPFLLTLSSNVQTRQQFRVLRSIGIRAEESFSRSVKQPFANEKRASNSRRQVDTWYPIFHETEKQVKASNQASGAPSHWAYDLGVDRFSCQFCIYAPREQLLIAARESPELAKQYADIERRIGRYFRLDISMQEVYAEQVGDTEELTRVRTAREKYAAIEGEKSRAKQKTKRLRSAQNFAPESREDFSMPLFEIAVPGRE